MGEKKFYNRVVILGSRSFVGKAIANKLQDNDIEPLLISRKEIDLESKICTFKLNKIIKNNDVVVVVAAKSPVPIAVPMPMHTPTKFLALSEA